MVVTVVAAGAVFGLVRRGAGDEGRPSVSQRRIQDTPTRWPIKHVVFLIKENRSYDNLFGLFPGANGATTGKLRGKTVPLRRGYDQRTPHDLLHNYAASIRDYNSGKMDGFGDDPFGRKYAYTVLHPDQIPNYWHWAKNYVLADNFFSSAWGPSFPNHLFTIAAQSGGTNVNPVVPKLGPFKTWGCDAPAGAYVIVEDSEGELSKVPPCFSFDTEGDLLERHRIPWAYYGAPPVPRHEAPRSGYIFSAYSAVRQLRDNPKRWRHHIFNVDNFIRDVRDGLLPAVTWVTPRFALSEHPEYNFCHGENWTTRVINEIMRSPQWKSTAIFVTWDDWGGFYDHVVPPQVDRFGMAMRVPLLVISPYAKRGHVDHEVGEFSSVLRFIEDNWRLGRLTRRDRSAGNLSYDFDFDQKPRPPDPLELRTDCRGPVWEKPPPESTKFGRWGRPDRKRFDRIKRLKDRS